MSPTMPSFPMAAREAALVARVVALMGELIAAHAPDLVVIACNTASTLVLPHLRERFTVPFVGTVPAIKPACAASAIEARVGARHRGDGRARIHARADPRFRQRQRCHAGRLGAACGASPRPSCRRRRSTMKRSVPRSRPASSTTAAARTDTIVLACTHYPLLLDRFERLAPWPVRWIDPGARRSRGAWSI